MRFFRREHLSDETIEQILSARQAPEPPSEATAASHLSAIMAESRRVRETAARPASRGRLLALPRGITASVAVATAFISLAIAGALPGPVQAAASDALAVVGISIPDGGDEPSEARREPKQRSDDPSPASSGTTRRAIEQDREEPRQAPAAVDVRTDQDRDGSGADSSADEPRSSGGERGGADDEGRRESDEGSGGEEESRDEESRRGSDDEADDEGTSGPGSDSDDDEPEDSSGSGDGGVAGDGEGPDAEPRPTGDEPDESGADTEARSGTSGDEPDAPED